MQMVRDKNKVGGKLYCIEDADFTASFNSNAGAGQCLEAKRAEPAARLSAA